MYLPLLMFTLLCPRSLLIYLSTLILNLKVMHMTNVHNVIPAPHQALAPLLTNLPPFLQGLFPGFGFAPRYRPSRRIGRPPKGFNHRTQANWTATYPFCNGTQQSPINIESFVASTDAGLFLEFDPFYNNWIDRAELFNDGVQVEMEFMGDQRPRISGSALNNDVYLFHQLHFHWGSEDVVGSEHAIDNVKFPLELHLVHFNERYTDFGTAADQRDGLAVLGVLFRISPLNNPLLDPLIRDLSNVRCANRKVTFDRRLVLAQLLPLNTRFFFQYTGSITSPPCFESVTWVVFREPVPIGREQLLQFRLLTSDNECRTPIGDNWRTLQPTNSRIIRKTLQPIW